VECYGNLCRLPTETTADLAAPLTRSPAPSPPPHTPSPPTPGALISLCLLAQAYDHVGDLIDALSVLDIGAEILVQVGGSTTAGY
jgi:hypothetical protein